MEYKKKPRKFARLRPKVVSLLLATGPLHRPTQLACFSSFRGLALCLFDGREAGLAVRCLLGGNCRFCAERRRSEEHREGLGQPEGRCELDLNRGQATLPLDCADKLERPAELERFGDGPRRVERRVDQMLFEHLARRPVGRSTLHRNGVDGAFAVYIADKLERPAELLRFRDGLRQAEVKILGGCGCGPVRLCLFAGLTNRGLAVHSEQTSVHHGDSPRG